MDEVKAKLDMKTIKLSGFEEHLKVRAAETKPAFPTRHDWDTFFKDNKNMNQMKSSISGIQTFSFGQDLVFDAFIQFKEYIGFVKVMNSLKGMKLLYKDRHEERAWTANIKVD